MRASLLLFAGRLSCLIMGGLPMGFARSPWAVSRSARRRRAGRTARSRWRRPGARLEVTAGVLCRIRSFLFSLGGCRRPTLTPKKTPFDDLHHGCPSDWGAVPSLTPSLSGAPMVSDVCAPPVFDTPAFGSSLSLASPDRELPGETVEPPVS